VVCLMFTAASFAGTTTTYVYDELDRLHEVQLGNGNGIRYEYDEIGNLKSKTPFGNVFTLSAAAGEGGSITSPGTVTVTAGSSKTYSITPLYGYKIAALSVGGTVLPAATTYTFSNVADNHYINAYFVQAASFTITATAAANGSISPAGATAVFEGSNKTYAITPGTGYVVASLVVDGAQLPGATSYTFTNVTTNHSINANFTVLPANSISIATNSLADGISGSPYSKALATTYGVNPLTWSVTSGSLPAGLSLATASGAITGTPTTAGSSSFTIQVRDNIGATADASLSINVKEPDGFILGASLRSPWLFSGYVGNGGAPITQSIATNSGHNANPAVDIHRSGTISAGNTETYSLRSDKNRNSCTFWYNMANVASSSVGVTWKDGTGAWVEDEGGQHWEANNYGGTLIADGTWRQFTLPAYSSYLEIHRSFQQHSVALDVHDYFDSFVENYVTITAAAGPNGSISPAGATAVQSGGNLVYTFAPNAGFKVAALVVDGTQLPAAATYTFSNVTANHYINAYFESAPSLTITAAAAANGSISPAGATAVTSGSNKTYTITPNPGFVVSALIVDGVQLPGATSYTFTNVTANHYINAYFGATITAAAAANGSISPAGSTVVMTGGSQTYIITPGPGFVVAALVVDGTQLPGATSYTFSNVTAGHYINAYFEPAPVFTITAAAAANGSISPAGATTVTSGSNQTYTITPSQGFTVAALVVDGTVLPGATSYNFTNVQAGHYINAYFQ